MIPSYLDVLLYGEKIGAISYIGGDRSLFSFDQTYIDNPNRPVLGLGFKNQYGDLIQNFLPTQTQLLPWFSNLLPEGPLRTYLAEKNGVKEVREYSLISALGHDLPGAVTILPATANPEYKESNNVGPADQNFEVPLKFSLAGVQLKFSAIEQRRGGLTIPAHGVGGDWIVKLPSLSFKGLSNNEYSMMSLASLIGMDIPEHKLIPLSSIEGLPKGIEKILEEAYAVKRFDRGDKGKRIHMEDFAQVFGVYPERKYERASARSIASVLWVETGEKGVREFIKRLVFNTLIGNADMHLKNWSLLYPDLNQAQLSPGYDFVSTIAYIPDENAALSYARTKKMKEFGKDELMYLASKSKIPEALVLEEASLTIAKFHEVWKENKNHLPLTKAVIQVVEKHVHSLSLLKI